MPRANVILTDEFPYHIVARSNNRDWFQVSPSVAWSVFRSRLNATSQRFHIRIHAFVVMSNHFHMLLSTPDRNLSEIMRYFLRESSRGIAREANRINHVFGARYKWCVIDHSQYVAHAYRYVYRNPVKAGLVTRAEDYSYSTLYFLHRNLPCGFPLFENDEMISDSLPTEHDARLEWINTQTREIESDLIRRALRRTRFRFSKNRNDKKALKVLLSRPSY
jgi:putative transposase